MSSNIFSTLHMLTCQYSLGKTISTITRILEGRPSLKDKKEGYCGTTLYVITSHLNIMR